MLLIAITIVAGCAKTPVNPTTNTTTPSSETSTTTEVTQTGSCQYGDAHLDRGVTINQTIFINTQIAGDIIESCLITDPSSCVNIVFYNGSFDNYYKSQMNPTDLAGLPSTWSPMIVSTINDAQNRTRTVSNIKETSLYYINHTCGTIIIPINSEIGTGFHGGNYTINQIIDNINR